MKIFNSKSIRRNLLKSSGNNFSLVSTRILLQKQKEASDIQYKFLHFAQPSLTRLREIGQNCGSVECTRCNRVDETQKHWILYELLHEYIDITQVIDNTVGDCLLYHLLEYEKEVSASRELFEIQFMTIRYLRKEAIQGNKYTREEELELFKNNIRKRLYFINNATKIQPTEEAFFRIC